MSSIHRQSFDVYYFINIARILFYYLFIYNLQFRVADVINLIMSVSLVPFHITTSVVIKIGKYINK